MSRANYRPSLQRECVHQGTRSFKGDLRSIRQVIDAIEEFRRRRGLPQGDAGGPAPAWPLPTPHALANGQHPQFPNLSDKLSVHGRELGQKGPERDVKAWKDLKPGDVLAAEPAFLALPLLHVDDVRLSHCGQCAAGTPFLYPCPTCADVLFCHECLINEEKSHVYECKCGVLAEGRRLKDDKMVVLLTGVIRMVVKHRWSYYTSNWKQLNIGNRYDMRKSSNEVYLFDDPERAWNLETFDEKSREPESKWRLAVTAVWAAELIVKSGYFPEDEPPRADDLTKLISLCVEGLRIIRLNGKLAWEFEESYRRTTSPDRCWLGEKERLPPAFPVRHFAVTLFNSVCLFNHSCAPNAHLIFDAHNGCRALIVATAKVPKGSSVTISYGIDLDSTDDFDRREEMLEKELGFECKCLACLSKLDGLKSLHTKQQAAAQAEQVVQNLKKAADTLTEECHQKRNMRRMIRKWSELYKIEETCKQVFNGNIGLLRGKDLFFCSLREHFIWALNKEYLIAMSEEDKLD